MHRVCRDQTLVAASEGEACLSLDIGDVGRGRCRDTHTRHAGLVSEGPPPRLEAGEGTESSEQQTKEIVVVAERERSEGDAT